jgi:hypothetical protein
VLDPRILVCKSQARTPCVARRLLSIRRSTSTPRASLDSDCGPLASCPRPDDLFARTLRCVSASFARSFRSVGSPLRGVVAAPTLRFCSTGHSCPHPHLDDRSSWWIYPRRRRSGHLMSPADARARLEGRTERRCGTVLERSARPNALDRRRACQKGLPADSHRETRVGKRYPRCLPSPRAPSRGRDAFVTLQTCRLSMTEAAC